MNLRDGLLYLVVFGPGVGESIVVRAPSGVWIVIDGCTSQGKSFPAECLRDHAASWSAVVLTHRHLDHADGLDAVLDSPGAGLVGCADPRVAEPTSWEGSADAGEQFNMGKVEHVLAAIRKRWQDTPESQWRIRRGHERVVGGVTLLALHPDEQTVARHPEDPNRLASAILVSWKDVRLLLGSDTVAADWAAIAEEYPEISRTHGVKMPHHGSMGAVHESWGEGPPDRLWVCTPFSSQRLPRYADDGGLAWALARTQRVNLTGLPMAHRLQGNVPYVTSRAALRDGVDPPPASLPLSDRLRFELRVDPGGADTCFVAAGFDSDGSLVDLQHGPGAVVVVETTAHGGVAAADSHGLEGP